MKFYLEIVESVTYAAEVEMTKEEFDDYWNRLGSNDAQISSRAAEQLRGWIDPAENYLDSGDPGILAFHEADAND